MPDYWRRVVDDELDRLLAELPAISLEGLRAVGKTTTALQRAVTCFELDDPDVREIIEADPRRLVETSGPTAIDEWQQLPRAWDLVRRAVDSGATPGRFILTGSASPASPPTHSGAGRIVTIRMRPLALFERRDNRLWGSPTVSLATLAAGSEPRITGRTEARLADYVAEILDGGFPGLRGLTAHALATALRGHIDRIVDRDYSSSGTQTRNPSSLRRWMSAYAAASATTASYEKIRDAATSGHGDKPSRQATAPIIDTLESLHVLDGVPAWAPTRNRLTRLTAGPKHFMADPALAAVLLRADAASLLRGRDNGPSMLREGTLLGALFESLMALNLRVYAQACEASVSHLRSWAGEREVDFILEARDGRVVAIEVKLATGVSDDDVRHLLWLRQQIGDDLADAAVITTGTEAYRRSDGIAVVPAALLGP